MPRKDTTQKRIDKGISAKVNEARVMRGVSTHSLGEAINVSHQQVQKYIEGESCISAGRLKAIADFLQLPISYFFEKDCIPVDNSRKMNLTLMRDFAILTEKQQKNINTLIKNLKEKNND